MATGGASNFSLGYQISNSQEGLEGGEQMGRTARARGLFALETLGHSGKRSLLSHTHTQKGWGWGEILILILILILINSCVWSDIVLQENLPLGHLDFSTQK